eukprot:15461132-Alexandrium_andersonii.AAC.1
MGALAAASFQQRGRTDKVQKHTVAFNPVFGPPAPPQWQHRERHSRPQPFLKKQDRKQTQRRNMASQGAPRPHEMTP